jgi:phosphoribosylformylglycinamidine synthase
MCKACNIDRIVRIEKSRRYLISSSSPVDHSFIATLYDRMTECIYDSQLTSFDNNIQPLPVKTIPLLTEGKSTLEKLNKEQGLGFDDWDIEYYYQIFVKTLKRNPTDVECFDLGQSNSEHSRHWFFGGKMIFDGKEQDGTLFSMVKGTLKNSSKNSVIAFHDNSSVSSYNQQHMKNYAYS